MANTIRIKRSAVSGKVPVTTDLELGELAVNTYDGKLYTKKDDGTASVVEIGASAGATDLGYTTAASTGTVTSSTGTDATIPAATTSLAGLLTGADKTKLDGIATGATANTGTVTSIATSGALTGGTITTSGTLSVRDGTTAQTGVVQLSNSTSSTSTTLAATSSAVKSAYDLANGKASLSGAIFTGDVYVGTGTADTQLTLRKADNNVSDHLVFCNGTTRVGEIGVEDTSWLRINQETATNIYTPRYIRADAGFFVDGTTYGISSTGLIRANSGSVSSPGLSFGSDDNTGFFLPAADTTAYAEGGSERLRINASGFIKVSNTGAYNNSTDTVHELRSNTTGQFVKRLDHFGSNPYGLFIKYSSAAPNNFSNHFLVCQDSGANKMWIQANGNCENANNVYKAFSDLKLKENIVDAQSQWDDIKAIRLVNYNFKEETGYETHKQLGVIAQELELTSPALVSESPTLGLDGQPDGGTVKGVAYSVLYLKAVGALQEAMARIETLEVQNAAFEARIAALEGKV